MHAIWDRETNEVIEVNIHSTEAFETWASMYQQEGLRDRRVALDKTIVRGEEITISTVFLGFNHGTKEDPIYFETMIFGGPNHEECVRWTTPSEARAGHLKIRDAVMLGKDPWDYLDGVEVFKEMLGLTFEKVEADEEHDQVLFWVNEEDGIGFRFYHDQDCCEHVEIDDIVGDLKDLAGSPMLVAECVTNSSDPPKPGYVESYTWSYYKFATVKGAVTIKWYGESNGYYSETVQMQKLPRPRNYLD